MAISGKEASQRVKGWAGFLLSFTPLLLAIPSAAVQAVALPLQEFLLALGFTGAVLQANSPKIIEVKKGK